MIVIPGGLSAGTGGGGVVSASRIQAQNAVTPELSETQLQNLGDAVFNDVNQGYNLGRSKIGVATGLAVGSVVNLADDVWSSPINPVGWVSDANAPGAIWGLASAEQQRFYNENRDLLETTSGVAGALLTATVGDHFVSKGASLLLGGTTLARGAAWARAVNWVPEAKRGVLAAQKAAIESGEKFSILSSSAGRNYLAANVSKNVAIGVRQEALTYAVMWNNEVVNSEDMSNNAFWSAAGIAFGGAIGALGARATVRQFANSPEVRDLAASRLTMAGASDIMTENLDAVMGNNLVKDGARFEPSVDVTTFLVASRANPPQGLETPAALMTQHKSLANQSKQVAAESLEKVFNHRIPGVEVVRDRAEDIEAARHIVEGVGKSDPFVFHGVASAGFTKLTPAQAVKERTVWIQDNLARARELLGSASAKKMDEGTKLVNQMSALRNQQPMALVNGRWQHAASDVVSQAHAFDQKAARAKMKVEDAGTRVSFSAPYKGNMDLSFDFSIGVRGDARIGQPRGEVEYGDLKPTDRFHVQEAAIKLMDAMAARKDKFSIRVTEAASKSWFKLDMLAEAHERGIKIQFDQASGLNSIEDVRRQTIRLKGRAIMSSVGKHGILSDTLRLKYNLPEATSMERLEDPHGSNMLQLLSLAAGRKATESELINALARDRAVHGFDLMPENAGRGPKLHGDMLKWNRNDKGKFMRPILAYHNPPSQIASLATKGHEELARAKIADRVRVMLSDKKTFVGDTSRALTAHPAMQIARKVSQLDSMQITGIGSAVKQVVSEFLPRSFLHRDNPILQAASQLLTYALRQADIRFQRMMTNADMRAVVTRADTPEKAALHAQLNAFFSLRPGWDIDKVVEVTPGKFAFQLADTKAMRDLMGLDRIQDGSFMQNLRAGKPLIVDAETMKVLNAYSKMTEDIRLSDNVIRDARGYTNVAKKFMFAPSQNTRGKLVGFVMDENGKMVKMNAIVASTQSEFDEISRLTLEELPNGYHVETREALERTRDIWDRGQMEWVDHGFSAATHKGTQAGGLTGALVRNDAFTEALEWVRRQTNRQANETLESLMAEPIRLARMRAIAADPGRTSSTIQRQQRFTRNIFDEYEQALTGHSRSWAESAILSKNISAAEATIDRILTSEGVHTTVTHVMDIARRFGVSPKAISQKKTYKQIVDVIGSDSPYLNQMDYLAQQNIHPPVRLRGITEKLNTLATNMVLRWDPLMAHASMNMLGLIPTLMSGAVAGSAPTSIELAVKGKKVKFVDALRIIKDGILDLASKRRVHDMHVMRINGDMSQSTFEYKQSMAAIESQAGFMKAMDNIDGMLAWASDGSENLSRQVSHMVGLRLAEAQGITGTDRIHDFAREFANAAVADYTPANRPELYRTALGSVIGLFQTYTMSQYTKMFQWMEQGQYKAVGVQAAFQASLFGLENTYGVGALFDAHDYFTQESGEPNLIDMAYRRFGPVVGGALMHGGFAELTQVALWTRGDVNLRLPSLGFHLPFSSDQAPAGIDVMMRLGRMMTGVVGETLSQGPVDAIPAAMEIIQREMPNRMLKGIMAVTLLDGKETDKFGAVMTETRDWVDTLIRIPGLRSRRMQAELEVFYANKSDIDKDAARAESVRMRMRTDMRTAARNGTSVNPQDYFDDYVASGGNPARFQTWLKQNLEEALTVRTARQLKKNLDTPRARLHLWRYGGYGVWE